MDTSPESEIFPTEAFWTEGEISGQNANFSLMPPKKSLKIVEFFCCQLLRFPFY